MIPVNKLATAWRRSPASVWRAIRLGRLEHKHVRVNGRPRVLVKRCAPLNRLRWGVLSHKEFIGRACKACAKLRPGESTKRAAST